MSALRQPSFSAESYHPKLKYKPKQTPSRYQKTRQVTAKSPANFPQVKTLPANLETLSLVQKTSFGIALVSMATSIGLYILTVNIPELWSQEYQNLENLQGQERQLIAINESLKYQIAEQAAQDTNLSISKPEQAVFITPAQVSIKTESNQQAEEQNIIDLKYTSLGY